MRLIPDGPDLPADLLRAQERGEVLFVCGAGVSCQAGLPNFCGLVEKVYGALGEDWQAHQIENALMKAEEYDRLLRALERRLIGTHDRQAQHQRRRIRHAVRDSLKACPGADLTAHRQLLELSRDGEQNFRLLTTNFDTLFERARKESGHPALPSHAGRAMPPAGTARFEGVLHLHGRIADADLNLDETDLVLTSAEFGDAYLRNGWASRYLYELVRTHVLVLVGYSADDPPMRYLLEAVDAERDRFPDLKPVYAFACVSASEDESLIKARWQAKGIEPLLYRMRDARNHALLYGTIGAWRDYAEDPTRWRRDHLSPLLKENPEVLGPEEYGEVVDLLRHGDADKLLEELSPEAAWLTPLTKRDALGKRVLNAAPWITTRLADPKMIRACAGRWMNEATRRIIEWHLNREDRRPELELRKAWRWILRASDQAGRSEPSYLWLQIRTDPAAQDEAMFRDAVADLLVPRLHVNQPPRWSSEQEPPESQVTANSLVWVDFKTSELPALPQVLNKTPQDTGIEERLLRRLTLELATSLELARDVGFLDGFDRSSEGVPSIAGHPQNQYRFGFCPLVRVIADLWERLAGHASERATAAARAWTVHPFVLFRRLYLHAVTNPTTFPSAIAGKELQKLPAPDFWSSELRRETMRLMALRWKEFPDRQRTALERKILRGPPRSMFRKDAQINRGQWRSIQDDAIFIRLERIQAAGGQLDEKTRAALQAIRQRHPQWVAGPDDRDDFSSYHIIFSGRRGNAATLAGTPVQELISKALRLQEEQPYGNGDLWSAFCSAEPERALEALAAEDNSNRFNNVLWHQYINSAINIERPALHKRIATDLLRRSDAEIDAILPATVAWLQRCRLQLLGDEPLSKDFFFRIWDRLADSAFGRPAQKTAPAVNSRDVMTDTLNAPSGQLARALADVLESRGLPADGGLPADLAPRFDRLVQAAGRPGLLARAYLLRILSWLFWLDPDWARDRLTPLLTGDGPESIALWQAYLQDDQARPLALFNLLKPSLLVRARSPELVASCAESLSGALLLPLLWKQQGTKDAWDITESEVKAALSTAPAALRRQAAWQLATRMAAEDAALPPPADRWHQLFGPVFTACWPQDAACRDAETSPHLFWLATTADAAFPAAVAAIVPFLVPFQILSIRAGIGFSPAEDALPSRFPQAYLVLLDTVIDPKVVAPPHDLADVLDVCEKADPTVTESRACRRLRAIARGQAS